MSFVCRKCKAESPAYSGQCPACKTWNAFAPPAGPGGTLGPRLIPSTSNEVVPTYSRLPSGVDVWDRALVGGIVLGTSLVVAGNPGNGKTTMALMAAAGYARAGHRVLFASCEENLNEVRITAHRVGALDDRLSFLCEENLPLATALGAAQNFDIAVFDSIQRFRLTLERVTVPRTRIFVSQLNGEGSIKGETGSEYNCTTVLFASDWDAEDADDDKRKRLRAVKNRTGAAGFNVPYTLEENGPVIWTEPVKKTAKKKGRGHLKAIS